MRSHDLGWRGKQGWNFISFLVSSATFDVTVVDNNTWLWQSVKKWIEGEAGFVTFSHKLESSDRSQSEENTQNNSDTDSSFSLLWVWWEFETNNAGIILCSFSSSSWFLNLFILWIKYYFANKSSSLNFCFLNIWCVHQVCGWTLSGPHL